VQQGLTYTVNKLHADESEPEECRHVTGPQLCEGLREFALAQWGFLATTVLRRWNVRTTYDFGRIVFALVDNGFMKKRDEDSIEDFRDVFRFEDAFDAAYRIEIKS
jgi:uncharacterized repeat protein (TIGR04138 family)